MSKLETIYIAGQIINVILFTLLWFYKREQFGVNTIGFLLMILFWPILVPVNFYWLWKKGAFK